jgi:hypothetical protein
MGKGLGLGERLSGIDSTDLSQIVGQLISRLQNCRPSVTSSRLQKSKRLSVWLSPFLCCQILAVIEHYNRPRSLRGISSGGCCLSECQMTFLSFWAGAFVYSQISNSNSEFGIHLMFDCLLELE